MTLTQEYGTMITPDAIIGAPAGHGWAGKRTGTAACSPRQIAPNATAQSTRRRWTHDNPGGLPGFDGDVVRPHCQYSGDVGRAVISDWRIEEMDVMEWAAGYEGEKFHALIADPPYELSFMSKSWDSTGIAFQPETWAALAEHLLPGAWVFAFASSRGWHRMAVAMEDSGLVLQPSIFVNGEMIELPLAFLHVEGQSFPKATRIDAQLEKRRNDDIRPVCRFLRAAMEAAGKKSTDIAQQFGFHSRMVDHWAARDTDSQPALPTWGQWQQLKEILILGDDWDSEVFRLNQRKGKPGELWKQRDITNIAQEWSNRSNYEITSSDGFRREKAVTPLAAAWEGHRYGGQVLKNAATPIICAQKPWTNPRLDCIVETGAGALWVDGGRIGTDTITTQGGDKFKGDGIYNSYATCDESKHQGRWPANFCLLHSPGCIRVGTKRVEGDGAFPKKIVTKNPIKFRGDEERPERIEMTDADGCEEVEEWRCVEGCAVKALGEQSGSRPAKQGGRAGRWLNGPFSNSIRDITRPSNIRDDSGTATRFYHNASWSYEVAERLAMANPVRYQAKAGRRERDAGLEVELEAMGAYEFRYRESGKGQFEGPTNVKRRNIHPTIKPIALIRWLATLLLPPEAYAPRRVLCPFSGVSSEGIGCGLAGFEEIVMIESEHEYAEIGRARCRHWFSSIQLEMAL